MTANKNTVIEIRPAKPFLKWAGSKRQLLPHFVNLYPDDLKAGRIKNYYEPFLGSGAVFFDVAQRYPLQHACLSDVNEELVLTFTTIQSNVAKLAEALFAHQKKYLALDKEKRLAYFYDQREKFNRERFNSGNKKNEGKQIARAAQLIFLNRTCFNGLFRVNSKGEFNTPAGDYASPCICDEENLLAVSKLLDKATIKKADFTELLKEVKPSAFIYLDPPYRPVSKTASFTAYSNAVFADKEQLLLAEIYGQLDKTGAAVMLSNSDTNDNFFDILYSDFNIRRIPARRLINADASKRGHINEIVVTNYLIK